MTTSAQRARIRKGGYFFVYCESGKFWSGTRWVTFLSEAKLWYFPSGVYEDAAAEAIRAEQETSVHAMVAYTFTTGAVVRAIRDDADKPGTMKKRRGDV